VRCRCLIKFGHVVVDGPQLARRAPRPEEHRIVLQGPVMDMLAVETRKLRDESVARLGLLPWRPDPA